MIDPSPARQEPGFALAPRALLALGLACAAAFAVGLFARLTGWDRAFWIDETYTGAIALQPKLAQFIDDTLNEVNGPVYYVITWLWVKLFGASNTSLRAPSLIFSLIAPLLVLWRGDPDRIVRYVWAALLAVVYMIAFYSHEARAYSMLLLLGLVQLLLFRALIERPTARTAYAWAAVSALFVLAHLFTLVLTGLQGLALVVFRGRALARAWPALLLFAVPFGWLALQLPVLMRFADPAVAWQDLVGLKQVIALQRDVFGRTPPFTWLTRILLAGMAATLVWDVVAYRRGHRPFPYRMADMLAIGTALAALAVILVYGHFRPSFTPRYMMHLLPALLLSFAVWCRRMAPRWPLVPAAVVSLFVVMGATMALQTMRNPMFGRLPLEWQEAAEAMMAANVRHVAFFWDEPQSKVPSHALMSRIGGFFFDRAHSGIRTEAVVLTPRADNPDPNRELRRYLDSTRRGDERDGFIWLGVPDDRSLWSRYPARLDELSAQFTCHDYVDDELFIALACIRRIPATPPAP